jgi:hypothetical protein
MAAVGLPMNLREPEAHRFRFTTRMSGQQRQLLQLTAAATREEQFVVPCTARPGAFRTGQAPALYESGAARRRQQREAMAQLRTGSHSGAEETGRWEHQPREARICPHCQMGVEDATCMIFECPLYAPQRRRWGDLFADLLLWF